MHHYIIVFFSLIGIIGCATPQSMLSRQLESKKICSPSNEFCEPEPIISKYIIRPTEIGLNTPSANIFLYRIKLFIGDGARGLVYLDNIPILNIMPGDYSSFKVPSGKHILYVMSPGITGIDIDSLIFDCLPQKDYFFCVTYDQIFTSTPEEGNKFIQGCKYIP